MNDDISHTTPPEKQPPESLKLRGRPRPVTRFNRRLLVIVTGISLLVMLTAFFYALDPEKSRVEKQKELYNVTAMEKTDKLEALPKTYTEYKPPQLGAPLPGELGEAVLKTEQRAGLAPLPAMTIDQPFRSDHLLDAMRSERIRQAQKALQAQEAPVFFQLSQGKAAREVSDPARGQLSESSALMKEAFQQDIAPDNGISGAQDHKLNFLRSSPKGTIYNPHSLQDPVSPYQVMAGTVIAASLITGLNSDLPGEIIAQVTEPVYDTVTGGYLLIPQGSRLLGRYDSVVAFGQDRALVVWQRLLLPDGSSMVLDNLPATDTAGFAGLKDQVDFHSWALIKGIGLSTILSIGGELAFQNTDSDLLKAVQRGSQDNINTAGQAIVERNLNIPPTIRIRPGFPLRVIVHKDIILRPYVVEGRNND